ncbi:MAG: hypothetical protein IPH84_11380 [Bacteroidales bacterium]|nr:hypothetical protein [Bacteroidales bacterium]
MLKKANFTAIMAFLSILFAKAQPIALLKSGFPALPSLAEINLLSFH